MMWFLWVFFLNSIFAPLWLHLHDYFLLKKKKHLGGWSKDIAFSFQHFRWLQNLFHFWVNLSSKVIPYLLQNSWTYIKLPLERDMIFQFLWQYMISFTSLRLKITFTIIFWNLIQGATGTYMQGFCYIKKARLNISGPAEKSVQEHLIQKLWRCHT